MSIWSCFVAMPINERFDWNDSVFVHVHSILKKTNPRDKLVREVLKINQLFLLFLSRINLTSGLSNIWPTHLRRNVAGGFEWPLPAFYRHLITLSWTFNVLFDYYVDTSQFYRYKMQLRWFNVALLRVRNEEKVWWWMSSSGSWVWSPLTKLTKEYISKVFYRSKIKMARKIKKIILKNWHRIKHII